MKNVGLRRIDLFNCVFELVLCDGSEQNDPKIMIITSIFFPQTYLQPAKDTNPFNAFMSSC